MQDPEKKIWPERNLERWSFWQPAQSKAQKEELVFQRETVENGMTSISKVEVRSVTKWGPLTTEDQKVYYALQKIWEEHGRPRTIRFSLRRLARELGKTFKANGIRNSLNRLRFTSFVWKNSFFSKVDNCKINQTDTFTILSSLKLVEPRDNQRTNKEECEAEFHPLIWENLQQNYTRPLFFQTVVGFSNGIAQILYTYFDLLLAHQDEVSRRSKQLFEDLNLSGQEYQKVSSRNRTLVRVLADLQGKALSSGGHLAVFLENTADGKDMKLVARRETVEFPVPLPVPIEEPAGFTALRFVERFLECFSHVRKPRATEVQKATEVMATSGLDSEKANEFLRFVVREAKKTNYQPATFQGIVKYLDFPWRKSEQSVEPVPSGVQAAITTVAEDELETAGLVLLSRLDPQESARLIEDQRQVLLNSEKRKVFQRWSKETMFEHCQRLVAISLATKGTPFSGS